MKTILRFCLCSMLISAAFSHAHAQSRPYVGALGGLSVPSYTDTSARPALGLLGGARLDGEWGFGAFFLTSSKSESMNNEDVAFNFHLYGVEGNYHFEGMAENAFVALRLGLGKVKAFGENYSPLIWGAAVGYDYPLQDNFSLGVDIGYFAVEGEAKSRGTDLDHFSMLNFILAAKLWF